MFSTELLLRLTELKSVDRMREISRQWKTLTDQQRHSYKEKRDKLQRKYEKELEAFKKVRCVCVCLCVRVGERRGERSCACCVSVGVRVCESALILSIVCVCVCVCVHVWGRGERDCACCVSVCVRVREREGERQSVFVSMSVRV